MLVLPEIGRLPAAGLRAGELAKLAGDRLQATSGSHERPLTIAQRRTPVPEVPPSRETTDVEGRSPAEQPRVVEPAATEQLQALERERSRVKALLRDLATARLEREAARRDARVAQQAARDDALSYIQGLAAERERAANLTQELNATRAGLETMKARMVEEASAAARNLTVVLREIEHLKTKAAGAIRSKAAALRARHVAQVALADARRALEEERHKLAAYERDLALARQSTAALQDRARLAMAEQAAAVQARKVAEAAARQAGEALALEREKGRSLARDLDTARQERDAAKEELARVSAAERKALEDERNGRDLATEPKEGDAGKARAPRRIGGIEHGAKGRAGNASERPKAVARTGARSVRDSGSPEIRKVETRKPTPSVRSVTIALPDALLPKRLLVRRR